MTETQLSNYDFSALAGLPVVVRKISVLRCSKCGEEMLQGKDVNRVLTAVAVEVLKQPGRLAGKEARFLRGQLGLTQQELAEKMGLHKITVAAWEGKKPISPQHDHILRAMVLAKLGGAADQLRAVLERVRIANPPKAPHRLVVTALAS